MSALAYGLPTTSTVPFYLTLPTVELTTTVTTTYTDTYLGLPSAVSSESSVTSSVSLVTDSGTSYSAHSITNGPTQSTFLVSADSEASSTVAALATLSSPRSIISSSASASLMITTAATATSSIVSSSTQAREYSLGSLGSGSQPSVKTPSFSGSTGFGQTPNLETATQSIQPTATTSGVNLGNIHNVQVGAFGATMFSPSSIDASVGDQVLFSFLGLNHTVTQSTFDHPCTPSKQFDTGFSFYNPLNQSKSPEQQALYLVRDSEPTWFFCRQNAPFSHCHAGMVFAINAGQSYGQFQENAKLPGVTGSGLSATSGLKLGSGQGTGTLSATTQAVSPAIATGVAALPSTDALTYPLPALLALLAI